jgi:hypothetical protein
MKPVSINFYDAPVWQRYRLGLLLLAVGATMSGITAWHGWQAYAELVQWDAELATFRQTSVGGETRQPERNALIGTELESANQIVARLNTPWAEFFSALEAVPSEDAVLLSVESEPDSRQVHLTAESRNTDSMLEFVRQLRASKVFTDAYVVSHAINEQDMHRPVRFSVTSHWPDPSFLPAAAIPEKNRAIAPTESPVERPNP